MAKSFELETLQMRLNDAQFQRLACTSAFNARCAP